MGGLHLRFQRLALYSGAHYTHAKFNASGDLLPNLGNFWFMTQRYVVTGRSEKLSESKIFA
jgi:hypothetical protein